LETEEEVGLDEPKSSDFVGGGGEIVGCKSFSGEVFKSTIVFNSELEERNSDFG
jgi:hypothetical protein